MTQRAVFLDRDGVINQAIVREGKPFPPADLSELRILPGVPEALARLRAAGFRIVVVTNQPDVARGRQTREMVEHIHTALMTGGAHGAALPLDDIRVCYHDDGDDCDCRKPAPEMLIAAARSMHLDLVASFMVGDRWRDIEAGRRAGCTTILIDYGYAEAGQCEPHMLAGSLAQAADLILSSVS